MAGATPELNLATAVDSDDNADYLTLSLANSLRTVDGLFNNITGHNHGGAHQGGPVSIGTAGITDGAITLAKLAANSVDSSKIVDGSIATADLADKSVTNAKLAADTARDNLLTNGGFEQWQRGNGPFTVGAAFCADRWQLNPNGTDTFSITRDVGNQDISSFACASCIFVLGSGGGLSSLIQGLKASDTPMIRGRTWSYSVRVKTTAANAVRAAVVSDGTGAAAATSSAPHSGGGAYETLTVSYFVPADATVFNIYVRFAASCTAYLDNAMLVVGSVAADYAPMHPADDLARCLRYYEKIGDAPTSYIFAGYNLAGAGDYRWHSYKARKAIAPTATKNGTWDCLNCSQPALSGYTSPDGCGLNVSVTATGTWFAAVNSVGQSFTFEANP